MDLDHFWRQNRKRRGEREKSWFNVQTWFKAILPFFSFPNVSHTASIHRSSFAFSPPEILIPLLQFSLLFLFSKHEDQASEQTAIYFSPLLPINQHHDCSILCQVKLMYFFCVKTFIMPNTNYIPFVSVSACYSDLCVCVLCVWGWCKDELLSLFSSSSLSTNTRRRKRNSRGKRVKRKKVSLVETWKEKPFTSAPSLLKWCSLHAITLILPELTHLRLCIKHRQEKKKKKHEWPGVCQSWTLLIHLLSRNEWRTDGASHSVPATNILLPAWYWFLLLLHDVCLLSAVGVN